MWKQLWSLAPRPQVRGLAPGPQKWSPEQRSPLKLTEPPCNLAKSSPDHHKQTLWPIWGKNAHQSPNFGLLVGILSWGYKNWPLTHKKHWLSLVCQVVGPLHLQVPTLSLLFVFNKLTAFWNALCLEILFQPMLGLPQQKPTQYCKAIILQLRINFFFFFKKKKKTLNSQSLRSVWCWESGVWMSHSDQPWAAKWPPGCMPQSPHIRRRKSICYSFFSPPQEWTNFAMESLVRLWAGS